MTRTQPARRIRLATRHARRVALLITFGTAGALLISAGLLVMPWAVEVLTGLTVSVEQYTFLGSIWGVFTAIVAALLLEDYKKNAEIRRNLLLIADMLLEIREVCELLAHGPKMGLLGPLGMMAASNLIVKSRMKNIEELFDYALNQTRIPRLALYARLNGLRTHLATRATLAERLLSWDELDAAGLIAARKDVVAWGLHGLDLVERAEFALAHSRN